MHLLKKFSQIIITGLAVALTACTSSATPVAKQESIPAVNTPLSTIQPVIPVNTSTPTATILPPTPTPTPTPKPGLEEILLTDARHMQGINDAPVTFIEFSDFK